MKLLRKQTLLFLLLSGLAGTLQAAILKGNITDKSTKEPLVGATIQVNGTGIGVVTDLDGNYHIENLKAGTYEIEIKYISYQTLIVKGVKVSEQQPYTLNAELLPESMALGEVTVVAQAKKNTDIALVSATRNSLLVQSGVSAQQILRTQDKDASEVIKRVPGISIINDKFVMVRGLSQRYNNVWINSSAVPSSESDSRAFSFDIIPSSQLDNMMIIKSPAPEYPADFSGGFILINTKDIPSNNSFSVSVGGGFNDETHFKDFLYSKGSGTDFLGFDNGLRSLDNGIHTSLHPINDYGVDLQKNNFNNNWTVKSKKTLPDMSLSMNVNRFWETTNGQTFAMLGAVNYSNSYKSYLDMENSLYSAYDKVNDKSVYLRKSKDDQYNNNVRIGAMLNLTYAPASKIHRYEFKNIFNQLAKDRYTYRKGINNQGNSFESAEYYYNSRTTYNGQFTGKHTFGTDKLDWSAGYAYVNNNLPDRRRYVKDDRNSPNVIVLNAWNDINREYTSLNEHIFSGNLNYTRNFELWGLAPTLKAGAYGEYRTRNYDTRNFYYTWNESNNVSSSLQQLDLTTELLTENNIGADKLFLIEDVNYTNNYVANNTLAAGYLGLNLPFGNFNIYAGVRFEHNNLELIRNTRVQEESHSSLYYKDNDFFPSLNATYKLNEKNQLRFSYGKSVNRPEFRELSASTFYDFDLGSFILGNTELKPCYIQNLDFRYEWYPSSGEQVTLAAFYKNFDNPIEWTYTVAGGNELVYSFRNAKSAVSYGLELDIRKNLDFIGLKDFSFIFNGSLIKSEVKFPAGDKERDREMQGQSPYLINTGLFYQNTRSQWNASLLYNRIGKRIVGVGRSTGVDSSGESIDVPDSYEMPRNTLDLNLSKQFGKHWEVKVAVRDLLAEKLYFKQFENITYTDGQRKELEEVVKSYKPGRNFNFNVSYKF